MQRHQEFARSVGLPLAVSEWSNNVDHGDSAQFMRSMFDFFKANAGTGPGQILYDVQFNVDAEERRWILFPVTRQPAAAASYRDTW
jgi:hypothetical protein